MGRRIIFIAFCFMSILLFSSFVSSSSLKTHHIVLKVSSSDPKEEVSFEAAYIFRMDTPKLQLLNQTTPVTIDENAENVSAIFHKIRGKANLQVSLSLEESQASADGEIVVVGTRLAKNGVGCFAQSY